MYIYVYIPYVIIAFRAIGAVLILAIFCWDVFEHLKYLSSNKTGYNSHTFKGNKTTLNHTTHQKLGSVSSPYVGNHRSNKLIKTIHAKHTHKPS